MRCFPCHYYRDPLTPQEGNTPTVQPPAWSVASPSKPRSTFDRPRPVDVGLHHGKGLVHDDCAARRYHGSFGQRWGFRGRCLASGVGGGVPPQPPEPAQRMAGHLVYLRLEEDLGGKIEASGPEFGDIGDIEVPELVAGLSVCGIADGMLRLLFRLPAFLMLAPRLLPAFGETGPEIVRVLPCALLGGTRAFAQFLPGRQGDRLVLGEKAGPMADAAAQGDGRPQPVR